MATRRTRRNGEMNQGHLKHNSPHPVVRPDEKVRSSRTVRAIFCNAGGLASQAFDVARGRCIERCTFDDGSAQIWYRDLSPTIAQRSISALLRVRVPMVLGRVATALHPASSSVRRVDVAGYNRCPVLMMVAPVGVGRGVERPTTTPIARAKTMRTPFEISGG
jgi:hypothetical protein